MSTRATDGKWSERLQFFWAFLCRPATVGAIAPSSRALARRMIEGFDLAGARTVVELGPGMGPFTGVILERLGPSATFLALELESTAVARLRQRFPQVNVYQDSAENLSGYLARCASPRADYIVSGLPWASLPVPMQDRIFQAILVGLAPGGRFTTFAYVHASWLPRARRFRRRLEAAFQTVTISPLVWGNLPPAFVYCCGGPRLNS